MIDLAEILGVYEEQNLSVNELRLIQTIRDQQLWEKLSLKEKLFKWKEHRSWFVTKFGEPSDDRKFDYERAFLQHFEVSLHFLSRYDLEDARSSDRDAQKLLVFRLRNLIYCELIAATRLSSIHHNIHLSPELMEPLFKGMSKEMMKKYDLDKVRSSYLEADRLWKIKS